MKIDIEGAEVDALKSMETILEDCRLVYCEVHEDMMGAPTRSPAALLRDRGFSEINHIYQRSGSHYIIRAQRE
jgi:hypothetical protein